MSVSIIIKPGTWPVRDKHGRWRLFGPDDEPNPVERFGMWAARYHGIELHEEFFDVNAFPTYAEPDWRKTKFQVS